MIMKTLRTLLIVTSLTLPILNPLAQAAENTQVTATKKLSEAAKNFEQTHNTSRTLLAINEKQVTLMKTSIKRIEERLAAVIDDATVPAARKRAMQKELLSKKRSLVEGILKSLKEGEQGVQLAAENYQASISGADTAAKYMRGYKASSTAMEQTKQEGRSLVTDYQKLQVQVENMDRADPNFFATRSQLQRQKQAIKNKVNELKRVSQKKAFMQAMAKRAEKFKDFVIARQDQMFYATDNFSEAIRQYEHKLEMINMQQDAASMADYPTEMLELNESLNKLFALSDDLNSQSTDQMLLPIFDEGSDVNINMSPVNDADLDEMIKLFFE
jgi:hypothetical protein